MPELSLDFEGQLYTLAPGIHFGMPENLYHAIPALSSTGFKNILTSLPDFYFNSWLNPLRDEDAEDDEAREWRKFGKASHSRVLEGRDVFYQLYCVEFIAPEGCLKTKDDLKKYCDDNGIESKTSWAKPKMIEAIKGAGHSPLIYDEAEANYFRETGGKIQMSQRDLRRIEIAAAMIEKHPELKLYFTGGYPEVTILWYDEAHGLWFKARLDYLKPRAIVDLKSFTNIGMRNIDLALYAATASNKYHIQVRHYIQAGQKAIEFARAGLINTYSQRHKPTPEFIKALGDSAGHEFFFCFQKKGGAPLARGKRFRQTIGMYSVADRCINDAIELFKQANARYGSDIWVDDSATSDFEDALFPVYATEI